MKFRTTLPLLLLAGLLCPSPADASLTATYQIVGNVGVSTDGFGSTGQSGSIQADVPFGATVLQAYLYTSTFSGFAGAGGTLNGTGVTYTPLFALPFLQAGRADVTSIVQPIIDGGVGGVYNFSVTETSDNQDGEALVVVYSLASLPIATVGVLDGGSSQSGDSTSINFGTPLDPSAAGFFADMRLGVGFSCCSQASTVKVNGTTITTTAGNNDDGVGSLSNGQLITMGGYDDPFSPLLPSYADDHERYDLQPYITIGDMSIVVNTANPSFDDNVFLATFWVTGEGGINQPAPVPEPSTLTLLGLGAIAVKGRRFFRRA